MGPRRSASIPESASNLGGLASWRRRLAISVWSALLLGAVASLASADDCVDTGSCRVAPRNIDVATAIGLAGPFIWLGWHVLSRSRPRGGQGQVRKPPDDPCKELRDRVAAGQRRIDELNKGLRETGAPLSGPLGEDAQERAARLAAARQALEDAQRAQAQAALSLAACERQRARDQDPCGELQSQIEELDRAIKSMEEAGGGGGFIDAPLGGDPDPAHPVRIRHPLQDARQLRERRRVQLANCQEMQAARDAWNKASDDEKRAMVRKILEKTASGRRLLDLLDKHGTRIVFGTPNGGTHYEGGDTNTITIDPTSDMDAAVLSMYHEMTHMSYEHEGKDADPTKESRQDYINKELAQEAASVMAEADGRRELKEEGIQTHEEDSGVTAYQGAHDNAVEAAKAKDPTLSAEALDKIGREAGQKAASDDYRKGQPSGTPPGTTYEGKYGKDWDEAHKAPAGQSPQAGPPQNGSPPGGAAGKLGG